jgi:hypothetical protein
MPADATAMFTTSAGTAYLKLVFTVFSSVSSILLTFEIGYFI